MLREGPDAASASDVENAEQGDTEYTTDAELVRRSKVPEFGSKGPLLHLLLDHPEGFTEPIHDNELIIRADPTLSPPKPMPAHDPQHPIWTPPCVVPNSAWCRGQYIVQLAKEVRGVEMQAIQNACISLVSLPVRCQRKDALRH